MLCYNKNKKGKIVDIILCVLCALCVVLLIFVLILLATKQSSVNLSQKDKKDVIDSFNNNIYLIAQTITDTQKVGNNAILTSLQTNRESALQNEQALEKRVMELIRQLDARMNDISKLQEDKLDQIRATTEQKIKQLQDDNNKHLDEIRQTVDEKLSKTINERFEQSFKVLSTQLESVYKSLGEMQNIASNVGNLTKVLSNVKTTGIFGEIQLGAIIEQILSKDQYETNFVTAEGREPVEFAVKLPGQENGSFVYLPIDSKFPLTVYTDLHTAYEDNQLDQVKLKKEQLRNTIKNMAKDIKTKYVCVPRTTNFAVMFLPIEGLYAEVAKMGLIEELQQTYNVTIAGPTTMSALLNSFQMGFRTLAIQKKSGEVWRILGAVKTEFRKYNELVAKIQTKFESASKDLDNLVGTRSRMIESKLRTVESLDESETPTVLGLTSPLPIDGDYPDTDE